MTPRPHAGWLECWRAARVAQDQPPAALLYLNRGDEASARRHAQRAADLEPFNTFLIRDHDLRKGDYATARAGTRRRSRTFAEGTADVQRS